MAGSDIITFAAFCRRAGISLPTATRLLKHSPHELPPVFELAGWRRVMTAHAEAWLEAKLKTGAWNSRNGAAPAIKGFDGHG